MLSVWAFGTRSTLRGTRRVATRTPFQKHIPPVAKPTQRVLRATGSEEDQETDVVIVGAGIGGLCAGALLKKYGYDVTVCEAHDRVGGCAHGFSRRVKNIQGAFHFDAGPSLFSGCAAPSSNPLRQVLDAVGAEVDWATYDSWNMYWPPNNKKEGTPGSSSSSEAPTVLFRSKCGDSSNFGDELARAANDPRERDHWRRLVKANENLGHVVGAAPPIALRPDVLGALRTAGPYLKQTLDPKKLAAFGLVDLPLRRVDPNGPFSNVLAAGNVPKDSLCYKWFDFLAFALSGLPVTATSAAACSFMMKEFFALGATMDFPRGGSQAVADALARGLDVRLRTFVDEILVSSSSEKSKTRRATGVRLRDGSVLRARVAVVSNAGAWGTAALLRGASFGSEEEDKVDDDDARDTTKALDRLAATPATPSFVHLHVAFRARDDDAAWNSTMHHIVVDDWARPIDAKDNLVFVAVPSVFDETAAPVGYHVLHAYLPATESWEDWAHFDRGSDEYEAFKARRAEPLWRAVETFIPDIKDRAVIALVGSPLTHARFTRRHHGTYGPAWRAGRETFPSHRPLSDVDGLFACGDSTFPGIGVPAVAGSGIAVAHSIVDVARHRRLLDEMAKAGTLR